MNQLTDHLLMIRPAHFGYNVETADNNVFQQRDDRIPPDVVEQRAREEFDGFVDKLRRHGIHVDVIEDTDTPVKSDAVFPNNWISLHEDGVVITYSMASPNRRLERREDILQFLQSSYQVTRRYAFEQYEDHGQFLEGTGSMVLDRQNKIVYACLSIRTDIRLLDKFCVLRGYDKVVFNAVSGGKPVYHTNVMMALGVEYAVVCLDCIPQADQREQLVAALEGSGKEIIAITTEQLEAFAGNMLQVCSVNGEPYCVMSERAYQSLTADQIMRLERHNKLLFSSLETIETFGGG
ncbi:MAG: arginine deiminase-related protein, partial [Saprospiraceae bacterium]|nr:arginine deiminase-related protein [Saprospiraceae bacterium]